jgi:hypothetical protein
VTTESKSEGKSQGMVFETGQIWQITGSTVRIGLVGKRLVHYKHFRGDTKGAPTSLANKLVLAKFLQQNKAVLEKPVVAKAAPAK